MASDGKIYIIVTDKLPGGEGPIAPDKPKDAEEKKDLLGDYAKHQFFNLIERQVKQAVNYSISNIGNFTGDYTQQAHLQDAMTILNSLMGVGISAFAGLKYTGSPVGAIVGAAVAVAGIGVSKVQGLLAGYAENTRQNRQIRQLRSRSGLDAINNGSRGTEY